MQDVILLVSTSAIFIFGYFLMRKLDVFLENNRNRQETALTYGENSLRIGFSNPFMAGGLADAFETPSPRPRAVPSRACAASPRRSFLSRAAMTSTFHMTCSARRSRRTSSFSSAPAQQARRSQPRPAPFRMRRRFSKFRISMMPFTPLRSRQSPVISCCCPRQAPPSTASRTLWSEARNSRKR